MPEVLISHIKVGDRYRKEDGDLTVLKTSIESIGLLQPIVLDSNYRLVCGGRRLQAFKELEREKIPARIVPITSIVLGEYAENEVRKDFTLSERSAIGEAVERELGERRGGDTSSGEQSNPQNFAECKGKETRQIAAEKAGLGNKETYRQVKKVTNQAESELVDAMDEGRIKPSVAADLADMPSADQVLLASKGKEKEAIHAAKEIRSEKAKKRRVKRIQKITEISTGNTDLPTDKTYPIIYADPPWRYEHVKTESRAIENQYPTMDLESICNLQIPAGNDAVLFLWVTSPKLEEGMRVLNEWGFTYRSCAVWDKQKMGMGYYFRQQHELLLVGTKGDIPAPEPGNRPRSLFSFDRTKHSSKPAEVAEMIEKMYPELPKIELFCREPREGWDVWGNQSAA